MNNQQGSSGVQKLGSCSTNIVDATASNTIMPLFKRAPQRLHVKMYNFPMAPTIGIWCKLYIIYNPNLNF